MTMPAGNNGPRQKSKQRYRNSRDRGNVDSGEEELKCKSGDQVDGRCGSYADLVGYNSEHETPGRLAAWPIKKPDDERLAK